METVYRLVLIAHIAGGFSALVLGLAAYLFTKGGPAHVLAGRIFFGGMVTVAFSAMAMHFMKANLFLFYIAIFTLYQVYAGWYSARHHDLKPNWGQRLFFLIALCTALLMILSLKVVLMVFGLFFLWLLSGDLRLYWLLRQGKNLDSRQWLRRHISMMSGAYIATTTAFLVVNLQNFQPFWLPWLLPSILGLPWMLYFLRRSPLLQKRKA